MNAETHPRRTPLHAVHQAAGARIVPFAGWEMPVWYTGMIDEHMAVRTKAGLFDVSHMGEIRVRGKEALRLLQTVTCNDVARLAPGRIQYTALTTPDGTFVDDLLVHKLSDDDYFLVVNASNTAKDVDWIARHARGLDVDSRDESEQWAQLALQGPRSAAILSSLALEDVVGRLKYYTFERTEVEGFPCLVSRTGYTGEDGFEIYAPPEAAERLWYAILGAGAPEGCVPVGLGARDTLRLEAKMALYGNDIDESTTVLEADLGWICKLDKGDFIGRDVLQRQKAEGVSRKLVGFETEGRAVARHGFPVLVEGREPGHVASGAFSPVFKKNIGLAYLPAGSWDPGCRFEIEIRGRRDPAVVVATPFYKRSR